MRQRILTALVAIPLLLLLVVLGEWYFFGICLLASVIALYEFYCFSQGLGYNLSLSLLLTGGLAAFLTMYLIGENRLDFSALIVLIIFILLAEMFRSKAVLKNGSLTILGLFYAGVLFAFLPLIRNLGLGYVVLLFLVTWGTDSFAYFIGIRFGRHKLWPAISPKKSWEGALGGLLGGILGGLVTAFLGFSTPLIGLLAGFFGGITAEVGDLMESAMKRESNVKDSGYILPGHGGILDRVDSLILLAPVIYFILRFFV